MGRGVFGNPSTVEREVLEENFKRLARLRILVLPLPLLVLGSVVVHEPAPWRRGALAALALGLVVLSVVDLRNVMLNRSRPYAPNMNLAAIGILHPLIVFATGGLESPVLPLLPALSLGIGLFAPVALTVVVVASQLILVFAMALVHVRGWIPGFMPDLLGGGATSRQTLHVILSAGVLSVVVVGAAWVGRALRSMFAHVLNRSLAAKDQALDAHLEQTQALTALSAEIAHELKNPLSSVKGLAALVSKDVEGKPAERLGVLRREIARMEESLEALLNFSRPTTPLMSAEEDLADCIANVVELHEGMARERGVKLVSNSASVVARFDRRKVRQVLINVVQNAIESSSPGGVVELFARTQSDVAVVDVLDRGSGLDAETAADLFEPGVTTREKGSGLGLPIARGLMRQHGGDLQLHPREGGGAVATLTLPTKGASQ